MQPEAKKYFLSLVTNGKKYFLSLVTNDKKYFTAFSLTCWASGYIITATACNSQKGFIFFKSS